MVTRLGCVGLDVTPAAAFSCFVAGLEAQAPPMIAIRSQHASLLLAVRYYGAHRILRREEMDSMACRKSNVAPRLREERFPLPIWKSTRMQN